MIPPAAQVAAVLRQPPPELAAVLFYGPDDGLVRERADTITRAVLGSAGDDPFRLTVLTPDVVRQDPARLADEAASLSLMGGRRVVRLREAGDAMAKPLAGLLAGPPFPALLVIEAGELAKGSSLRKLVEEMGNGAAVACYPDGPREVAQVIRETLAARRIVIADEAVEYLLQNLGSDRMVTRQEIEKLTLLAGDGGSISLADAIASVGDSSTLALDDLVYDTLDGKAAAVENALSRLFLEGMAAVTVLRAVQRHVHRLHFCAAQVAQGGSIDGVVRGLRPPIFFKVERRFKTQLEAWPVERVRRVLRLLTQAELDCKTTGYPDETICRHVLTGIGRLARRPAR